MNIFTIDCQIESKETGNVYPQLEIYKGASYKDPNSIVNLSDNNNLKQTSTVFELCKHARFTDLISWGSLKYPVISERLKALLLEYNLFDTQFIPTKIKDHESESWWILNPRYSNEALGLIDYNKTIFGELDPDIRKVVREFKFPLNAIDWREQWREEQKTFNQEYHELVINEIHFTESGNKYDLIQISPLLNISGTVISERLKERLESEKITGLSISEFEWKKQQDNS